MGSFQNAWPGRSVASTARAITGTVIALMKSRRRIAFTKAGTTPNGTRLQQGFAIDEMGFGIKLHSSNSEPLMSALGQKQTLH